MMTIKNAGSTWDAEGALTFQPLAGVEILAWPVQERSASPACADLPSRRVREEISLGGPSSFSARGLLTNLLLLYDHIC